MARSPQLPPVTGVGDVDRDAKGLNSLRSVGCSMTGDGAPKSESESEETSASSLVPSAVAAGFAVVVFVGSSCDADAVAALPEPGVN